MAREQDLAADFPHGSSSTETVRLFKDDVLGVGSYGKVCRAERDYLLCAAKIIHETLFDPTAMRPSLGSSNPHEQRRTPFDRFRQECEFLRNLRHPNIIQYLGTYRDPDTRLPVLLMELMEESLTHYLEEQQDHVLYHVQVNICNDIALALVFLHANNIIHRDLSSNNVLLSGVPGNITAKVTDFGMARLVDPASVGMIRDHSYSLTTCPGATVYMPPEAVQDHPVYTSKIDCFSFGVLIIQILSRQFPNPRDRYIQVHNTNPHNTHRQRILVEIVPEIDRRRNHISQIDPNHLLLPTALDCLRDRDLERPTAQQLCERMDLLKQDQEYTESIRQNPPRADRQNQPRLRPRRVPENVCHERLDTHQAVCVQREPAAVPVVADTQAMRLTWIRGNSAPCEMYRWCDAVVGEGVVYFRRAGLNNLHINYSYSIANQCWNQLPRCPLGHPTLIVIDRQLTGIGDKNPLSCQLSTLQRRGRSQQWVTMYPPMPTRRYLTTALCTETVLIVAGGVGEGNRLLTTVEVMQRENQQWSAAASLPLPLTRCSVTFLNEHIYLLGGLTVRESSRRVLSCSLRHLLDSCTLRNPSGRGDGARTCNIIWNALSDLPVYDSTCVSFHCSLLAIGGRDEQDNPTSAVHIYVPATNTWEVVSHMETQRYQCFAAAIVANQQIMVIGGAVQKYPRFMCTSEVEVASMRVL